MRDPGKLIKAEKWWSEKAPLVLGLVYALLAFSSHVLPMTQYAPALLAFVVAFVGVAGYGHVINDLADREHDRAAGKHNTMQQKSNVESAWIVGALLALAWTPWLFLAASRWNLGLVGLQLFLLTAYAVPPVRLKVRAVPGVLADALYAYTVPMAITWTTWSRLAGSAKPHSALLLALLPWSLIVGLRGILYHQFADVDNDRRSGVATFAIRFGPERALWLLYWFVAPLEILCFGSLTVVLARIWPLYLVGVGLFFCWRAFEVAYLQSRPEDDIRLRPKEHFLQCYGYQFLSEFYALWFPVFMLLELIHRSLSYLPIAVLHCLVFRTGLFQMLRYDLSYLRLGLARMRRRYA